MTDLSPPLPKLYAPQDLSVPPGAGEAVSIVIRTKDRPLLLPRALASVLGQSFTDWRLYLVNDGGDAALLEALLAQYRPAFGSRLQVIQHATTQGMEAASNTGLTQAQGRYFAIHDDDDAWHPDFLRQTTAFLDAPSNASYAGVATACEVVQERIESGQVVKIAQFPWIYFTPPVSFGAVLARNQVPPIALLLRRSVLARTGDYNAHLPVLGDWEFLLRVLAVGDIGAIETPLAFYHHRLAAGQDIYANSVSAGLNIHRETQVRLGNQIVRDALAQQPALLGVLWPILQAIEASEKARAEMVEAVHQQTRLTQEMAGRLTALESEIHAIRQGMKPQPPLLAPLRVLQGWLRPRQH